MTYFFVVEHAVELIHCLDHSFSKVQASLQLISRLVDPQNIDDLLVTLEPAQREVRPSPGPPCPQGGARLG